MPFFLIIFGKGFEGPRSVVEIVTDESSYCFIKLMCNTVLGTAVAATSNQLSPRLLFCEPA
jgi:hypothetical protein